MCVCHDTPVVVREQVSGVSSTRPSRGVWLGLYLLLCRGGKLSGLSQATQLVILEFAVAYSCDDPIPLSFGYLTPIFLPGKYVEWQGDPRVKGELEAAVKAPIDLGFFYIDSRYRPITSIH